MTTGDDENNQDEQSQNSDDKKKQVVVDEIIPKRPEILSTDKLLNFSLDKEPEEKPPAVNTDNDDE